MKAFSIASQFANSLYFTGRESFTIDVKGDETRVHINGSVVTFADCPNQLTWIEVRTMHTDPVSFYQVSVDVDTVCEITRMVRRLL